MAVRGGVERWSSREAPGGGTARLCNSERSAGGKAVATFPDQGPPTRTCCNKFAIGKLL
jgi:hypothetical protein